jgi:hypothetical protein
LRFLAFLPLTWAGSAAAQTVTDGDTLKEGGITDRPWGIDSPQLLQTCPDGWPAAAATRLQVLVQKASGLRD